MVSESRGFQSALERPALLKYLTVPHTTLTLITLHMTVCTHVCGPHRISGEPVEASQVDSLSKGRANYLVHMCMSSQSFAELSMNREVLLEAVSRFCVKFLGCS